MIITSLKEVFKKNILIEFFDKIDENLLPF